MPTATFRVHGSLDDFIGTARRGRPIVREFADSPGIKDVIQALGPPHPEVDLIVVNGRPVGFDYRLRPGDLVDVFGLDRPPEPSGAIGLVPLPPDPPRFVLDGHLGRLARYLRMLGFDSLYAAQATDPELARQSGADQRILLTRDRGLLKRSIVRHGYLVRDDDPRRQLVEVVARYGLSRTAAPFSRCVGCNGTIAPVERAEVAERLAGEPRTLRYFDTFGRCGGCGSIYWPGSHYDRMSRLAAEVLRSDTRIGENQADQHARRSVE
ncbi:MAG: Mut7-C RNAse domain-containing protein [Candidatus Limnocylindrales bacterium]